MNKKELERLLADKKAEMLAIVDGASAEKRSLTEEEKEKFSALEAERDMLHLRYKSVENMPEAVVLDGNRADIAKRFAEQMVSVAEGKGSLSINLRAIQTEPTIHNAAVPVLFQDLQKPFEKGLILDKLGGRVLYDVQGEPMWPLVTGIEANVLGENTNVGESTLAFTQVKSTPKRISVKIPVSRRAINQSNLDLYGIVMDALGMAVSRKLNRILCEITPNGEYVGPFVLSTLTSARNLSRGGSAVTMDNILSLEHAVLNELTDSIGDPAFLMNYKMAQTLRNTPIVAGQPEMILKMHREGGYHYGEMAGRRVEFSNYVPDGYIHFGDFNFLGIPQFGNIDITVDPYSRSGENVVQFVLNTDMDMVKIRPEAFATSHA